MEDGWICVCARTQAHVCIYMCMRVHLEVSACMHEHTQSLLCEIVRDTHCKRPLGLETQKRPVL